MLQYPADAVFVEGLVYHVAVVNAVIDEVTHDHVARVGEIVITAALLHQFEIVALRKAQKQGQFIDERLFGDKKAAEENEKPLRL